MTDANVDFNFFKPTTDDLALALANAIVMKHNESYTFQIIELKEQSTDKGTMVIIKCKITDCDNKDNVGKEYNLFIRNNPVAKRQWIELLSCFYTNEQMIAGLSPSQLIAKKFSSVCKETAKEDGTKFYNFNKFKGITDGVEINSSVPSFI